MITGPLKSLTRITSFLGKEITQVARRPGALLSLVLGPFLIMALFGLGFTGQRRPLDAVLVIPAEANLPGDVAHYQQLAGPGIRVIEVTQDTHQPRARLQQEQIDLVLVVPPDVERQIQRGEQATIQVEYNQIDPVRNDYVRFVAERQVHELNRTMIERSVREGKQRLGQTAGAQPNPDIPPEVVAAPTRPELRNWAPIQPSMVAFFAPAVLALVLQHMAVTLTALSLVRERLSGAIELYRVSPVAPLEILLGKYLAYGLFSLLLGAAVSVLMVGALEVPLLGSVAYFGAVAGLLIFASLGLGLVISTLSDSERQAIQLSMLVLLASVFLSGFVLPLDEFQPVVRGLAYLLPVTHGIRLLQDMMLRGETHAFWQVWALGAVGLGLFVVAGQTLRRGLAHG